MSTNNSIGNVARTAGKAVQECSKQVLDKTTALTEGESAKQKKEIKLENLEPPTNNIKTNSPSTKYTEEELLLVDLDGDGEITNEEIYTIIHNHHKEMECISDEYDKKHEEEIDYAWANKGTWSEQKQEYMNAKDVIYRDEHPEYDAAKDLTLGGKCNKYTNKLDKK